MHFIFSILRTALAVGNANYITPKSITQAARLLRKGETQPSGITVHPGMLASPPSTTAMQIFAAGQRSGRSMVRDFGWDITYLDDLAQLWFGTGPQIDHLGRLGESGVY